MNSSGFFLLTAENTLIVISLEDMVHAWLLSADKSSIAEWTGMTFVVVILTLQNECCGNAYYTKFIQTTVNMNGDV